MFLGEAIHHCSELCCRNLLPLSRADVAPDETALMTRRGRLRSTTVASSTPARRRGARPLGRACAATAFECSCAFGDCTDAAHRLRRGRCPGARMLHRLRFPWSFAAPRGRKALTSVRRWATLGERAASGSIG